MITLEATSHTIQDVVDEETRKGAKAQCFTRGECVLCFLYYANHHKRVMVFMTERGRVTRVLDTDNTQTGVLLDSMIPLDDFRAWLKEEGLGEEFVDKYLQDHARDLRVLLYAITSWAVSSDTSTLSDIPLGVTGIAQLNERAGSALVTELVKAVTNRGG